MMKARLLSVLLAVSLLCSIPANALTPPVLDGGHDEEGPFILCAEYDRTGIASWPYTKNLIVLENNEKLRVQETEGSLGNALPSQMAYVCENGKTRNIDVVWNTSDETLTQPGLHQVIGYPVTDDETILLAEGYDGKVTWPVFRKGGEALEVVSLQKPLLADPLLPLNGDASSLCISTDGCKWGVGADGVIRSDDSWVWTWDCSEVNTSKEGRYTVTGTLEPPEWICVNDADRISQNTVYVLPTDRIEIYAAVETLVTGTSGQSSGGELVIKWLYDSANVTDTVLQRMDENGLWVDCEDSWYRYNAPSKFVNGSTAKLRLRLLEISPGIEHRLRLRYLDLIDGETVERTTAPITLTVPENIEDLLADSKGAIPEGLNIGGDRDEDDFGDQDEKPTSGEIIPPPDTDLSTDTTNPPPTNTTDTTNDNTSNSASESTGGTTCEPTTDSTTAPTELPHNSEPDTSDSAETTEDKTNSTSQTENITTPSTDPTNTQPQKDGSSPRTIDIIMILLGLAVAGGIVCILLLWRKGGRK